MKYAELRVAYKDAKNLVARYKEDVRMLQQQVAECANDIATAKTLQAENKRLKRELDKPVEDPKLAILEAENKRLKKELDKPVVDPKLAVLETENKRLKRELDKLVVDPKIATLQAENKRLKKELNKLKDQPVKTVVDKKMSDELVALRRRVRYYEQMQ